MSLFPAGAPYDCKIDANDEIKWDGSRIFTVKGGPYYFDGSLSMSGMQQVDLHRERRDLLQRDDLHERAGLDLRSHDGVTATTSHGHALTTTYSCNTQWDPAGTRVSGANRGSWQSGTTYVTGDLVTGSDGKRYAATAGSTSIDPVTHHGTLDPWVERTNEIVLVAGCWANTAGSSHVTYSAGGPTASTLPARTPSRSAPC